jgi:hypothetical protein
MAVSIAAARPCQPVILSVSGQVLVHPDGDRAEIAAAHLAVVVLHHYHQAWSVGSQM